MNDCILERKESLRICQKPIAVVDKLFHKTALVRYFNKLCEGYQEVATIRSVYFTKAATKLLLYMKLLLFLLVIFKKIKFVQKKAAEFLGKYDRNIDQ